MHSKKSFFLIFAILFSTVLHAKGPWFTGPLLASAGHVIPAGHTNFELYSFFTETDGIYDQNGQFIRTPHSWNTTINPVYSHGLFDGVDLQFAFPFVENSAMGIRFHHLADVNVTLGLQWLEQKNSKWRPDLRFSIQQTLPTGRFDRLNPLNNGTDASGIGSYQTGFALNFQHLAQLSPYNYLRTRLNISYLLASEADVHGLNSFGGTFTTHGKVDPGNLFGLDLAAELNLTQNWVGVMEFYYSNREAATFSGHPGRDTFGNPLLIGGTGPTIQYTIAPAIEYNFNEQLGLIAGVWFDIAGQSTVKFHTATIAINYYF